MSFKSTMYTNAGKVAGSQTGIDSITVKHNPRSNGRKMVLTYIGGAVREVEMTLGQARELSRLLVADDPCDDWKVIGSV